MTIEEKIRPNLIYNVGARLSKILKTSGTNNDGEHLYYIKANIINITANTANNSNNNFQIVFNHLPYGMSK